VNVKTGIDRQIFLTSVLEDEFAVIVKPRLSNDRRSYPAASAYPRSPRDESKIRKY
jgi:hypothetical protein